MLQPTPPPDTTAADRPVELEPAPANRFLQAGLVGLVVAASAAAGLFALDLIDGDAGSGLESADANGQQVVAGPGETPVPDRGPADGDGDPLTVSAPPAGDGGGVVAPAPDPTGPTASDPSTSGSPDPTAETGSSDITATPTTAASTAPAPSRSTTAGAGQDGQPSTATSGRSTTTSGQRSTVPTTRSTASPTTTRPTTIRATTTIRTTSIRTTRPSTTVRPTTTRPTTTGPTTTGTGPTTTVGGSGTVVWEDHFDSLDVSTWRREHSTYGDGNDELQCYRPDNVSVVGGKLILQARTETVTCPNGSTRQVSSGMVRSQGVTFSPGQAIEFRVKLNPADASDQGGLWPAVWASGWAGGGWPAGGELDWLEVMTAEDATRAMFSMHYAGTDGAHQLQNRGVRGAANFSAAWHTVRFDYGRNGQLRWSLDGAPAFAVDAAQTLQGYPAPFDQTIREIKINLALGGRPGPLAAGAVGSTGATFEVDYIRIIQL